MNRPQTLKVVLLAVLLLVFNSLFCYVFAGPGGKMTPQPGNSDGYLRGGAVVVLRLPTTQLPFDQIRIFDDHHASRAFMPLPDPWASVQVMLPNPIWQDVEALRQAWCQQRPALRTLTAGEPYYEVALKCGPGFNTPVFTVPPDQLPPALTALLQNLPPAPATGQH